MRKLDLQRLSDFWKLHKDTWAVSEKTGIQIYVFGPEAECPFFSHSPQCQSSSEGACVDGHDDGDGDDKNGGDIDDGGGDGGDSSGDICDGHDSNTDAEIVRVMKMLLVTLMVNIAGS